MLPKVWARHQSEASSCSVCVVVKTEVTAGIFCQISRSSVDCHIAHWKNPQCIAIHWQALGSKLTVGPDRGELEGGQLLPDKAPGSPGPTEPGTRLLI
jgi:hypothetical protein